MNISPLKQSLIIFAVALLLLILFLFSCGEGNGADGKDAPNNTEPVSFDTDSETDSETEELTTEKNHTSVKESENGEYTIVTSKRGDVYYVYDDHAKLVKIAPGTTQLILTHIKGKEVTDISKSAFDGIPDKANFRIFGDSSSKGRKLAQMSGCIFIEWFSGYLIPNHYYPYKGDRSVWKENTEAIRADLVIDNSQRIDTCLSHYKTNSSAESLLKEAILHKISFAAEISRLFSTDLPAYYEREYTSSVVDDYDKYSLYMPGNADEEYIRVRFGENGTYEEIADYLSTIYTQDVIDSDFNGQLIEADGFAYMKEESGTDSVVYTGGEYSISVSDNTVTLSSTHTDENGSTVKSEYTLIRDGITWKFDKYVPHFGFEITDYEQLKKQNEGKYDFEYEVVTTEKGDVFHVYKDHAELVYVEGYINSSSSTEIQWKRRDILLTEINGVPVTKIADDALNKACDLSNFRIFAKENEHFRSYAMDVGCIFIELYNGSFPNHYYPYNGDESVWGDNTYEYDLWEMSFDIVSRSDELDKAVDHYLRTGEGYDEVYELVLYYYAAAEHFFYAECDTLPLVFQRKYESANVDDYDKYCIFDLDSKGNLISYVAVKYGEYDTYEELKNLMKILYTNDYVEEYFAEESFGLKCNLSVDGYRFTYETGIGTPTEYENPHLSLFIERNCILLRTQYEIWVYDFDIQTGIFTGKYSPISNFFLVKDNGKWCWEQGILDAGQSVNLYKEYLSNK